MVPEGAPVICNLQPVLPERIVPRYTALPGRKFNCDKHLRPLMRPRLCGTRRCYAAAAVSPIYVRRHEQAPCQA